MTENKQIKFCDHCGKKPPKGIIQFEGYFKVVCLDCSKEYYKDRPESHHVEYDCAKPGIYEAEFSKD